MCLCICICVYLSSLRWWMSPLHYHCVHLFLQPQMDSACNADWHYIDVKQGVWRLFFRYSGTPTKIDIQLSTSHVQEHGYWKQGNTSHWLILVTNQCAGWEDDRWRLVYKRTGTPVSWFFNQSCMPSTPLSSFSLQRGCLMCIYE